MIRTLQQRTSLFVLTSILAACGGGGGSGSADTSSAASADVSSAASADLSSPASADLSSPVSEDTSSSSSAGASSPASAGVSSPASVDVSSPASVDVSSPAIDDVVSPVTEDIDGCPTDMEPILVQSFHDGFEGNSSRWGPSDVWGYDADKGLYPHLDSDGDGIGDVAAYAPWPTPAYPSVNTQAVQVTDGFAEGITPRAGSQSLKFTVTPGDVSSNGNRAELSLYKNQDGVCSEAWYAWSILIPLDYKPPSTGKGFQTIGQWHAQGFGDNPLNFNLLDANHTENDTGQDLLVVNHKVTVGDVVTTIKLYEQEITLGNWLDVVVHVKWSLADDGFVEAWTREVPDPTAATNPYAEVVFLTGNTTRLYAPTVANDLGNFFKIGLYRSKDPTRSNTIGQVYYDEVRRGNSFSEVAVTPKAIAP